MWAYCNDIIIGSPFMHRNLAYTFLFNIYNNNVWQWLPYNYLEPFIHLIMELTFNMK